MGMINLEKGQTLHRAGDIVKTLEIVLKGTVYVTDGEIEMAMPSGSMIGAFELPSQEYVFSYEIKEACTVFQYSYQESEDIGKVMLANPKITGLLTSRMVKMAQDFYGGYERQKELAGEDYNRLRGQMEEYPMYCKLIGEEPETFPELETIAPPPEEDYIPKWEVDFIHAIVKQDEFLTKYFYSKGGEISVGVALTCVQFAGHVIDEADAYRQYRMDLKEEARGFHAARVMVETKANAVRSQNQGGSDDIPEITNAMDTILIYAGVDGDTVSETRKLITSYKAHSDRSETSDELRLLRRSITSKFYKIYEGAFFKATENPAELPIEVKMFLMFGFLDEELAGKKYTGELYRIAREYLGDPKGQVLTMYEWLQLIYEGKVQPSRNEFDMDYPAALREEKNNGDITEEEYKALLTDNMNKVRFELNNMCTLGNRMTFGRITTFQPVFDEQNVLRPLDRAFLSPDVLHSELDKIRSIDYSIFYRERDYNNEDLQIAHFAVQKEILPYMILMPNVGSRMSLWQEIDGKDRGTPGRMVLPIFMIEDVNKALVSVCGEYRWEMCKTIQGIHWSDVTDPSLTSEYNDYIQCYRKNHAISAENKEKIKSALKKVGNNLKKAFVADYVVYMTAESNGSPVMNKVARGILFRYCPFEKEVRQRVSSNPQYAEIIHSHENQAKQKAHPVMLLMKRIESSGGQVPAEVTEQLEFLQK